MTDDESDFSIDEAMAAQRALRASLGLDEERFALPALVGMISDEIEGMRRAGQSDEQIAALASRAMGRVLTAADITQHFAEPEARRRG